MRQVYLFDAYGTLFDLGKAFALAEARVGDRLGEVLERWRTRQLEHAWLSALQGRFRAFDDVTRAAFADSLQSVGLDDSDLVERLVRSFAHLDAYADAAVTLRGLKSKGALCAILSNGSRASLEAAARHAEIASSLDTIITTEVITTYKPAPAAYALGTERYGVMPKDIVFVSSNWWDVDGARAFGYNVVWIDRGTTRWPTSVPRPKHRVSSLSELTTASFA